MMIGVRHTAQATFRRDNVKHVWPEILPLFEQHWREITHFPDIPLDPDYEFYVKADEMGMLRVFVARDSVTDALIGYAVFFVKANPHYKKHVYAMQDVLFIRKDRRGVFGMRFIGWCDEQLRAEGVHVVTHHTKAKTNLDFGPAIARVHGYELVDHIYCRRLNP